MGYVDLSSATDEKVFGYAVTYLDTLTFQRLSTKPCLTLKEVKKLFAKVIADQDIYHLGDLSDVSMGFFSMSNAYLPYAQEQNAELAKFDRELVFYAKTRHLSRLWDHEPYTILIIWQVMSKTVYLVPADMSDLWRYEKCADDTIKLIFPGGLEYFEAEGHPFTEKIFFERIYQVHWKGLFKKKPVSIEALKDVVRYTGCYDDRTRWCERLDYQEEHEPFWLVRHKDEVKPITSGDVRFPSYREFPPPWVRNPYGHVEE